MSIAAMVAGALLAASTQPAPAPAPHSVAELVTAFGAVCLDHLGDSGAQIAAARAAPWSYAPDGQTEEHVMRFRSALGTLGVRESNRACTVTGELEPQMNLRTFQAAMSTTLPLDDGTPLEPPTSVYWLITPTGSSEQFVLALKVSNETGRNLATLWVQKREPR